jgi:hypothetical protein
MSTVPKAVPLVTRDEDVDSSLLSLSSDVPFPEPNSIQPFTLYHPMVPHLTFPQEENKAQRPNLNPSKLTANPPNYPPSKLHSRKATHHSINSGKFSLTTSNTATQSSDDEDAPDSPRTSSLISNLTIAPNGSIHRFKSSSVLSHDLDDAAKSRFLDELTALYHQTQQEKDVLQQQIDQTKEKQRLLHKEISGLEGQLADSQGATTRQKTESLITSKIELLDVYEVELNELQMKWRECSLECDAMQMELSQVNQLKSDILLRRYENQQLDEYLSSFALKNHQKRIKKLKLIVHHQIKTNELIKRKHEEYEEKRRISNENAYLFAMKRLKNVLKENQLRKLEMEKFVEDRRIEQAKQLLSLKEQVGGVMEELRRANELHQQRKAEKELKRMKERMELEGAGHNADQLFHQRDLEDRLTRFVQKKKIQKQIQQEKIKVAIEREERKRRELMKEEQLKQFVKEEELRKRGNNVIDIERFQVRKKKEKVQSIMEQMEKRKAERKRKEEERAANPLLYDAIHGTQDEMLKAAELTNDEDNPDSPDEESKEFHSRPSNVPSLQVDPALIPADSNDDQALSLPAISKTNIFIQRAQKTKLNIGLEKRRKALQEGIPKVVCGKSYTKASQFIAEPSSVRFIDFEVGQAYEQTIEITNVSFSFNHFKLLPIEDSMTDFFVVSYQPVGRMSAGSTAKVHIKFTPRLNQDLSTMIPFLAETGPFGVPVYCCTKKVNISMDYNQIHFGSVILGESNKQEIIIKNDGALGVEWRIERVQTTHKDHSINQIQEENKQMNHEHEQASTDKNEIGLKTIRLDVDIPISNDHNNPIVSSLDSSLITGLNFENRQETIDSTSQLEFSLSGSIDGYSQLRIPIVYHPLVDSPFELSYQIQFGPKPEQMKLKRYRHLQWNSSSEFPLLLTGEGSKVPIYLDNDVLNFQVCASNKVYRSHFIVCNRGNNAHQIDFCLSNEWKRWIEFVPSMAYVQAKSSMKIQVKFHPDKLLEHKLEEQGENNENDENNQLSDESPALIARSFNVSGEIHVFQQKLPVPFHIHGHLSSFALVPNTVQLNFGRCFVDQTRLFTIELHNPSPFLQQIHFPQLNSLIQISPDDGFLAIPPGRTMPFLVHFTPKSAISHDFSIKLISKMRQTIDFHVQATVELSPIQFSSSLFRFPPTPNGEIDRTNIYLTNSSSSHDQLIEFAFPLNPLSPFTPELSNPLIEQQFHSFLSISPSVARLKPGETMRFEIEFSPLYHAPVELIESEDEEEKENEEEETRKAAAAAALAGIESGAKTPKSGSTTPSKSKLTKKQIEAERLKLEEEEKKRKEAAEQEKKKKEEEKAVKQAEINAVKGIERLREQERENNRIKPQLDSIIPQLIRFSCHESNEEAWSRHGRHRIATLIQSIDSTHSTPITPLSALYFTVETTIIEPKLQFFPSEIDFGLLSASESKVKTVELRNFTEYSLQISGAEQFLPLEPFQLLTPLADWIQPNSSLYLSIEYKPRRERKSKLRAQFRGTGSSVSGALTSLVLTGQCIKPKVAIEPANASLHLGNILSGEIARKFITITNQHTEFPFDFDFQSAAPPPPDTQNPLASLGNAERNLRGSSEFSFFPAFGSIAPGETKQITVLFQPDHASESEFKAQIAIGSQRFTVSGRAHERPLFVIGGDKIHGIQAGDESSGSFVSTSNPSLGLTCLADGALKYQNPLAFLDSDPALALSSIGSLYPALFQSNKPTSASAPVKSASSVPAVNPSKRKAVESTDVSVPPLQLALQFNPLAFVEAPQKVGPPQTLWTSALVVRCCESGDGKEKEKGEPSSSYEASILQAVNNLSTISVAAALGNNIAISAPGTASSSKRPQVPNATQTAAQTGSLSSVDSLWSVQPSSGAVKPGEEISVTFQFNYTEYLRLKALDVESELLGVSGLLERPARIVLKNATGGNQIVEIKLKVPTQ